MQLGYQVKMRSGELCIKVNTLRIFVLWR